MEMQSGDEIVAASARPARLRATIMGGVAALAVLLSAMGLFAAMRQIVAQRRKEFGIRMALGAAPAVLLRAVCRSGVGLAAAGIAGGLITTLVLARYVRSLLYGISPIDPAVLVSVGSFMLVVAVAAAVYPAWRTSRLSPTLAIRNE
jgi:putative ABC transport system permease protein